MMMMITIVMEQLANLGEKENFNLHSHLMSNKRKDSSLSDLSKCIP